VTGKVSTVLAESNVSLPPGLQTSNLPADCLGPESALALMFAMSMGLPSALAFTCITRTEDSDMIVTKALELFLPDALSDTNSNCR